MGLKLTKPEMISLFNAYSRIFDVVRLVDTTLSIQFLPDENGELVKTPYKCYAFWKRGARCENCISSKALSLDKQMAKLEFVDEDVYFVLSIPVEYLDNKLVLELVLRLGEDTLFGAYGKNDFIESIEAHNKKLYVDPLTGAYNRRYFEEQLRHLRNVTALAMIDLDNFKNVNDEFGHAAGDEVLKGAVGAMFSCVRTSDVVVRYGGDEFMIAFQRMPREALDLRLETLREKIAEMRIDSRGRINVTASIGVAYSPSGAMDLLEKADQAMYKAKERKNCVIIEEY